MGTWKKASSRSRVQPHEGSTMPNAIDWMKSILKWVTTRYLFSRKWSRIGRNGLSFLETRKSGKRGWWSGVGTSDYLPCQQFVKEGFESWELSLPGHATGRWMGGKTGGGVWYWRSRTWYIILATVGSPKASNSLLWDEFRSSPLSYCETLCPMTSLVGDENLSQKWRGQA